MDDGFELPQPLRVAEHRGAEFRAVDDAVRHRPGNAASISGAARPR